MNQTHPQIRLGLVQARACEDPARNVSHTIELMGQAASQGAQVICTQELFTSPYFAQEEDHKWFSVAEEIPGGPTTRVLQEFARQRDVVVVGSFFERRIAGVYHNTAVVIDAGGAVLGLYRKMHIPDDPLYFEKFYFTPGDLGFRTWQTRFGRIGVLICWDQWFPEAARLTAMRGADILLYPTAIGWHPAEKAACGEAQHAAWETIQRGHAIANGCYVAAVNRIGHERIAGDGIEFWGQSFVAGPDGAVITRAPVDEETVLVATLDTARVEETRTHWPFLRDRRIDAYGGLLQRVGDGPPAQTGA